MILSGLNSITEWWTSAVSGVTWLIVATGIGIAMIIIAIGAIMYFSSYNGGAGRKLVLQGTVLLVTLLMLYMVVFGLESPPDISQFFNPPGW